MKKIVHLSDLHFGTENPEIITAILNDIDTIVPDLVVISGDLTQRARSVQFEAAADFLNKINFPKIVVPGNHDISFWNIFRRFFKPLKRFQKHISNDEFPIYRDEEMIIVGVNSARSLTIMGGRISEKQIQHLKKIFCNTPEPRFKGIVIHHNLIPSPKVQTHKLLGRGELLISELKSCGADIIFSGHIHKFHSADVQKYFKDSDSILIVQAGTASSSRVRGENNSYNYLEIEPDKITINIMRFNGSIFVEENEKIYERTKIF
jgi:3',5'-cyclic AMP phosphodiesterase CpdA